MLAQHVASGKGQQPYTALLVSLVVSTIQHVVSGGHSEPSLQWTESEIREVEVRVLLEMKEVRGCRFISANLIKGM